MKSFLELVEETKQGEKHHVMTFGRMNPPTTGHLKLIDKVKEVAKEHNAGHTVVTSHSQDAKKNPLSGEQKVKHLQRYSPGTHFKTSSKEHPTFLHHAAELHKQGVTHLHMVAGSDRVKEYKEKLNKYNGTHNGALYNFKKITVHSAGQRDPDAEGTTGMSGTKMRDAASEKRFHDVRDKTGKVVKHGFRNGVPGHVSDEHAKQLMHDTRKGMGLHENLNRGLFKAIFVTGGPGSGKDIIIREAIPESRAVELNSNQAYDYLADKQKLSEKTNDFRREAIRNRGPLIINGPADSIEKINHIKEELEDLGYSTMMVFVNTTNEVSQERNTKLSRMMVESIRYDKWSQAQKNKQLFSESFDKFIQVDNTGSLESIEEDITQTYLNIHNFIEGKIYGDISLSWLEKHGKLNISDNLIKEQKNVKVNSKLFENKARLIRTSVPKADGLDSYPADNRPNDSNADDIKWNANSKRKTFIFRTYSEAQEPTLTVNPQPKETNFSKDKEKVNKKRIVDAPTVSQRLRNTTGVGPEFDTRQQGTVYPMSGLGDVTYREQKEFSSFRKTIKEYKGFQNDISISDMGVGGTLNGATNFEPMQSYKDANRNIGTEIKIKKKKQEK
jgi:cytidyltransferase-like protein